MLIGATGSSALIFLAVLACPIGMGLMMFFMGRGMMGHNKRPHNGDQDERSTSLSEMKAEQARLAEKIDALEQRRADGDVAEPRVDHKLGRMS